MNPTDTADRFNPSRIFKALRERAWLIALSTIVTTTAAYVISQQQEALYESTATLLSTPSNSNNALSGLQVPLSPLPQGALEKALSDRDLLEKIIKGLEDSNAGSAEQRASIKAALEKEAVDRQLETFIVKCRLDLQGSGTCELSARNSNPAMAATLANVAANELVRWDVGRGLVKVRDARATAEARLNQVNAQLVSARTTDDRETYLKLKAQYTDQVNSLLALERNASGTLSVISKALPPTDAIAPKPLRNAVLAALATMLVALSVIVFRSEVNRRINDESDLKALGLKLLGSLPKVARKRGESALQTVLELGKALDDVAFVRANLSVLLAKNTPKVILVTSPMPGDGKSSVTATLAESFANAGQRTLIIDADLRRAGQGGIWSEHKANAWVNLSSTPTATSPSGHNHGQNRKSDKSTLIDGDGEITKQHYLKLAIQEPDKAKARKLSDRLHFLPAGPVTWRSAAELLANGSLAAALKKWGGNYDVILIDSPPALAVADAVMLAPYTNGVVVVLEAGRTAQEALERVIEKFSLGGRANILGVVFNKANPRNRDRYSYYPPKGQALPPRGRGNSRASADITSLNIEARPLGS